MENTEKQTLLIDLHYLPSTYFFAKILAHDEIILEAHEHYSKQTFRNRTCVLGANKVENLIIPVQSGNKKIAVRDIKIDYSDKWMLVHWRTITAAYNKAPFFEYFADDFRKIYEKKNEFLWDLNMDFLTLCLKILRINKTFRLTENYETTPQNTIIDKRGLISPKKSIESYPDFQPKPYKQNFGNEFVPNLSIIDLIFCQGNRSVEILKNSLII